MIKNILFGFGLSSVFVLIKFITLYLSKKDKEDSFKDIDFKNILFEWLFSSIALSFFFSVSIYLKNINNLIFVFLGILFGSFLMSYGFFIYPLLIILRKKNFQTSVFYENWAKENISNTIIIRILKHDMVNAYATGVLSASKVILLSDKLIATLKEKDIKNLIYHEYAHLKFNHLLILYLSNILCCSLSVISASHFYPLFETTVTPGLLVGLHGALFGVLYILIPGLVQRKLEYKADKYASEIVGASSYTETLLQLNEATNGGLEKKAINYPNLTDRIKNVSEK